MFLEACNKSCSIIFEFSLTGSAVLPATSILEFPACPHTAGSRQFEQGLSSMKSSSRLTTTKRSCVRLDDISSRLTKTQRMLTENHSPKQRAGRGMVRYFFDDAVSQDFSHTTSHCSRLRRTTCHSRPLQNIRSISRTVGGWLRLLG